MPPRALAALALTLLAAGPALAVGEGNDLLPDIPQGPHTVELQVVADLSPNVVIEIASAYDGSGRVFIVQPDGVIRILRYDTLLATPFLTAPASPPDRAMSGLAFHPDFASNRKLYLITGEAIPNGSTPHYFAPQDDTASAFDNVLVEYLVDAGDPNVVDPSTRRELLRVRQPHRLHNMNDLTFGGDGLLYVSMGDGGTTREGTPTHYNTNGQLTDNPFGAVLRIDVDTLGANGRYGIPSGNPFPAGPVPEIYAFGLRNPWRISTDRLSGRVYTGVNGDFTIETVVEVQAGVNYGWDAKEGSFLWNPATGEATVDPAPDPQYTAPLAEYDHNGSVQAFGSAIGGFVYRGFRIPELFGRYVFFDYVAGEIVSMNYWTGALELVAISPAGAQLMPFVDITTGEDGMGEIYIGRATGEVLKIRSTGPVPVLPSWALGAAAAALLAAPLAGARRRR